MNINSGGSVVNSFSSNGLSGLASGIDTESMVEKMLSATQNKLNKQKQNKQILTWKQNIYRGLITKISSFQSKYFDTLSKSNLMSSAFFNQRKASVTGNALSVLAGANADVGNTRVQVAQLAKAAEANSSQSVSGDLSGAAGDMDDAFKRQLVFEVNNENWSDENPQHLTVDLDYGDTETEIVDKVNNALQGAGVGSAELDDGKLVIKMNEGKQLKVDSDFTDEATGTKSESTSMGLKTLGLYAGARTSVGKDDETAKLTSTINTEAQASLEVTINGKTRNITLDEAKLRSPDGGRSLSEELVRQLNEGIHANSAFGENAGVDVKLSGGQILFDPIDRGQRVSVSGDKAALTIIGQKDGASNLINLGQRLGDVKFAGGQTLTANTTIKNAQGVEVDAIGFTINGQEFKFSMDTSVNTMISKINNSKAGVKVDYDKFEDTFKFTSTETGKGYTLEFSDTVAELDADGNPTGAPTQSGNLLAFMLGQNAGDVGAAEITEGQNAVVNINGVWTERDNNTFDVNGLTLTLTDTTTAYQTKSGDLPAGVTYEGGHAFAWNAATGSYNVTNPDGSVDKNVTLYDDGDGGFYMYDKDSKAYVQYGADGSLKKETDGTVKQFSLADIAGAEIDLTDQANKDKEIKITTERDNEKLLETIKTFVDDYNAIIKEIQDLTGAKSTYKDYPPLSDEQKKEMSESEIKLWEEKAQTGLLRQDQTLVSFTSGMRSIMYEKPDGNNYALYDLGIETSADWEKGGILTFDEDKLKEMISKDPDAITRLFTDPSEGLAYKMGEQLKEVVGYVGASGSGSLVELAGLEGTSSEKDNSIYKEMLSVDARIDVLKRQYETEKTRYWRQFNQMEQAIQQMNSQSAWLAQQLG